MRFEITYPGKRPVVKVYFEDSRNTIVCFLGDSASPSIDQHVREVHVMINGQGKAGYNILGNLYPRETLIHCFERALSLKDFANFWGRALNYMGGLRGGTATVTGGAAAFRVEDVKKLVLGTESSLKKFKKEI